jgi:ArsR family transcriptional regulator
MAAPSDDWTARLWDVVRDDLQSSPAAVQDSAREGTVLGERRRRSREYFSSVAGRWDEVRGELFGQHLDLHIALALIEPTAVIGDLGCGSGHQAELLAPHVARVLAIDASAEMVNTARARLAPFPNVSVQQADLEQLPFEDGALDIALVTLVLHYTADPRRVIAEARRTIKVGGRIVVIDMLPHQREDLTASMGHVWPGFSEGQMWSWLSEAGFGDIRIRPLPADVHAKGPALLLATAGRLV